MPVGLIPIASLLEDNGYRTKIVHTGIEQMLEPNTKPANIAKRYKPDVVAIDLHWYSHAHNAMNLAQSCKETTGCTVVLGGFTASFFSEEILRRFPYVDMVIRGDGELPMLKLMDRLSTGESLDEVPNLSYRRDDHTVNNPLSYIADEDDLNRLDFVRLRLVEHWREYIRLMSLKSKLDEPNFLRRGWLCVGRGCTFNCSYCGGSSEAQRMISGRQRPIFRSTDKVAGDIAILQELSVRQLYVDFDPYPENRRYYHELFDAVRQEKVDIGCELLTWGLPDDEFIKHFARTFDPYFSMITISPESGSEKVRKLNRTCQYSNESLTRQIEALEREGVYVQLFFSVGLTEERRSDFKLTIKLATRLRDRFQNIIGPWCYGIPIEPGAPRFLHPSSHGATIYRHTFADFYIFEKMLANGQSPNHPYGYRTRHMSEEDISELEREFVKKVNTMTLPL